MRSIQRSLLAVAAISIGGALGGAASMPSLLPPGPSGYRKQRTHRKKTPKTDADFQALLKAEHKRERKRLRKANP